MERAAGVGIINRHLFGQGKAMNQLPSWRSQRSQTLWLSRLIEAVEQISRPERRARPVGSLELLAVRARLAQPAATHPAYRSRFSLLN